MDERPIIRTPTQDIISPTMKRPVRNPAEHECAAQLMQDGWEVTKRGWPDFIAWKDGRMIIIEVKPKRSRRLKRTQWRIMMQLAKHGVECYRWDPESGYTRITPGHKRIPVPVSSHD